MTAERWTFYNSYPDTRQESRQLALFRDAVRRLTDGAIDIDARCDVDVTEGDQHALAWLPNAGRVIAHLRSSQLQNADPVLRAAYAMGSARDIREHVRAMPALEDVYESVLARYGLTPIVFLPSAIFMISVFSQREPVRTLDALRRRKLRVFSKDLEPTFRRLGVDATFIPQPELHDALSDGRADCTIYPACHTVWSVPLWRTTQHAAYLFPETLPPNLLAIPTSTWRALDEPQRRALRRAAVDIYPEYLRISTSLAAENAARESLAAAGLAWHDDFTVADQDAFARSADRTWADLAAAAGGPGVAARASVLAAMGRTDSPSP